MTATVDIRVGNCLDLLREIPDESVQCCVTSPPYWGLRDYGVKGAYGLEPTPAEYISNQVAVFDEVYRVLKKDGTAWVNMGDSYSMHGAGAYGKEKEYGASETRRGRRTPPEGLKAKDLCGMPWRLAFALQSAGWYLRCDIIWHKPNPMPESVTDRPTKSHEYIFLLSKGERYYYDAAAIREPVTGNAHLRGNGVNPKTYKTPDGWDTSSGTGAHGTIHREGREKGKYANNGVAFGHGTDAEERKRGRIKTPGKNSRIHVDRDPAHEIKAKRPRQNDSFSAAVCGLVDDRNKRSVWTVATAPFKEAHFATFPPDLIKPCILAGCMGGGTVIDPYGGSGTTGMVALELGRNAILLELNPEYAAMAKRRCSVTAGFAI